MKIQTNYFHTVPNQSRLRPAPKKKAIPSSIKIESISKRSFHFKQPTASL